MCELVLSATSFTGEQTGSPERRRESRIARGHQWYESRSPGLGDRLWREIEAAIDLISTHPEIGARVQRIRFPEAVRRIRLSHFPFLLIYRERDDYLEVIALAHTSRKPRYWRSRLT
ncbi:MAG TPA: type II toxin-antitoxin system RelE/ParE family toxin [Thermoanaerobaculia bacterium]|jgi:plasmid stabilization system protein ParE|nr:type II toxin-antitoxin system RelE/ParE family toxin [Thermoanaerobaculia bacterium]